ETGKNMIFILVLFGACAVSGTALFLTNKKLAEARRALTELALKSTIKSDEMATQIGVDKNLDLLRSTLFGLGAPRLVGEELYFGDTLVNGDSRIVDMVKARYGGAATIFLRDRRIATNVLNNASQRAVGTTLAAGPAYENVFGKGISYRGEALILNEAYIALYEPLLLRGEVIGILFVGVKKAEIAHSVMSPNSIGMLINKLSTTIEGQFNATEEALHQRQVYEDGRRRQDDERHSQALQQSDALRVLADALGELTRGNLAFQIEQAVPAEFRVLQENFNDAFSHLCGTMQAVMRNVSDVGSSAEEIRQASENLSRRAEQQAATLEQTSAALDQITTTVTQTSGDVVKAQGIAASAMVNVERSGDVLTATTEAMSRIEGSSRQISNIISVIDEIAFQTNLLALNAGVEAARAGDAGRGFAVVASEIRNLAQRSAEASKEIKSLISASGADVAVGVDLVQQTAALMTGITEQVAMLSELMKNVASNASEQANSLSEINTAVRQMDHVTQQNAAMAEESTAATHSLSSEAGNLGQLLRQFQLTAVERRKEKPVLQHAR
ncbi:MAG TPA: methyl-accepting chemotaxis protein, partial [Acidocella sp.]|nr:methyl-accepting chemotaxis protein [Acidocella sp.]